MFRRLANWLRQCGLRLILGKSGYRDYKRSEAFRELMETAAFVYTHNPQQGLRLFVAATSGHPDNFIQGLRASALLELKHRMSIVANNPDEMN